MEIKDKEPEMMDLESMDIAEDNRLKLKELFPNVFKETRNEDGELIESIDFEKLKAELGEFSDVFESWKERYGMDWPGKKECMKLIQQPSVATLKPCREESVNFDETENLFIEGDNLEVLKLLQKSYYGKVKMIYIDPPYNTGKEFIYPDKYSESLETYLAYAGLVDDEGRKFSTNTPNEGRFHTKWLNMMYPRLYLARNLLKEDGVIFISIDDNEVNNLQILMNEIFGETNFLAEIIWKNSSRTSERIAIEHEYIIMFCKNISSLNKPWTKPREEAEHLITFINNIKSKGVSHDKATELLSREIKRIQEKSENKDDIKWLSNYNNLDDNWSIYYAVDLSGEGQGPDRYFGDKLVPAPPGRHWMSQDYINELYSQNRIIWRGDRAYRKLYIHESKENLKSVITLPTRRGSEFLKRLLGKDIFDKPKPHELVSKFAYYCTSNDELILDFFSGSGTTANSVLDLNFEHGSNRKFIMIQLPEPCAEDTEAYKAGYKNIADIGKERIRRVISNIQEEQETKKKESEGKLPGMKEGQPNLDLGFKVFKLDRSNFKLWEELSPDASEEEIGKQLELHIEHINPESSQEDILYELLLKAGFMPTSKVEKIELGGKTVFSISDGALLICLEDEITKELIDAVVEAEPFQFICLDKGFKGNDQLKANAVQTFDSLNQDRDKEERIFFRTV